MSRGYNSGAPAYPPKNIQLNHTTTQEELNRLAYGSKTTNPSKTIPTPPRSTTSLSQSHFDPHSGTAYGQQFFNLPENEYTEGRFFPSGHHANLYNTPPAPKLPLRPQGLKSPISSSSQVNSKSSSSSMMGPRPFNVRKSATNLNQQQSIPALNNNNVDSSFGDFENSPYNSPDVIYRHNSLASPSSPINTPINRQPYQPSQLSPRRSMVQPNNLVTPSKAPYPDIVLDQDISQLPETPSLDYFAQSSTPATFTQPFISPSISRSSPSPQRRPMGPRSMTSSSSFQTIASPSTSPIKFHDYNQNRKSVVSIQSTDLERFVNSEIDSIHPANQYDDGLFGGISTDQLRERSSEQTQNQAPYPTGTPYSTALPDLSQSIHTTVESSPSPFYHPPTLNKASTFESVSTFNSTSTLSKTSWAPYPQNDFGLCEQDTQPNTERFRNISLGSSIPLVPKKKQSDKELPPPPSLMDTQISSYKGRSLPFSADSISARQLAQASKIQFLSSIFEFSLRLKHEWTDGQSLTVKEYKKFLYKVIKYHLPKLKSFIIEDQIDNIIRSFDSQNCIFADNATDLIDFFPNVKPQGILIVLTGCYNLCHAYRSGSQYQCHSPRCSLTDYRPPVPETFQKVGSSEKLPDWATFWKLTPQDLQEIPEDELKKQSHLFDLIRQQQNIVKLGKIQVEVYGASFKAATPKLVKDVSSFTEDAFDPVEPLINLHQRYLLDPLVDKLNQEGKFITGVGEIFLNWTQHAKNAYLHYTRSQANVREFIKSEKLKNSEFVNWLRSVDQLPVVMEASLDHDRIFSSGFIGHTQQLPLALSAIQKYYRADEIEYKLLNQVVEFIDQLNRRIDSLQERSLNRRHLKLLSKTLRWKNTIPEVKLDLLAENRKFLKKSDVLFKDGWSGHAPRTLILLDNYLLITVQDEGIFKVIENPIPTSILQVELKPRYDSSSNNDDELYAFKVKHSGLGITYTFYTEEDRDRMLWFESFKEAKASTVTKGTILEPFKVSILSDRFALTTRKVMSNTQTLMSPQLENALRELNPDMKLSARQIMDSEILCSDSFQFKDKSFYLIGLNYGLFLTEADNINWKRVLQIPKVTQVEVMNNLVVLISGKGLYYFNLTSILLNYYDINHERTVIGDRLSSKDNVVLFKTAIHNGAKLLFVLKMSLTGSKFKIFAPVLDALNEYHYFQLYKRLDIDSTKINSIITFNEYFILLTDTEFEFYKYDSNFKTQKFKVSTDSKSSGGLSSNFKRDQTESIKKMLKKEVARPLFIKDSPFQTKNIYLVYEEFAIVVNSSGDLLSDSHILPLNLKSSQAVIFKNFLVCCNEEVIQVFDLGYDKNGFKRLQCVEIIHGAGINMINKHDLMFVMMHPKQVDRQLLFSLTYLMEN